MHVSSFIHLGLIMIYEGKLVEQKDHPHFFIWFGQMPTFVDTLINTVSLWVQCGQMVCAQRPEWLKQINQGVLRDDWVAKYSECLGPGLQPLIPIGADHA